jgi:cytochrome P450
MHSLWALVSAFSVFGFLAYHALNRKTRKLPPGPAPWPIIGNLPHFPPAGVPEYQHWIRHKDEYGPMSTIRVMGQTMIFLHDAEAVSDLLEKRSRVTSSRPYMEFAYNLAGYGGYLTSQSYTDNFRLQRKLMHQQLGTRKLVDRYSSIQETEVAYLLVRILEEPEKLVEHFEYEAGATILKMAYGYSVEKRKPDPMVRLVDRMMINFSQAFQPLKWPVDAFPALKHLPAGLPGLSFKKIGREWSHINNLVVNIPYTFAKRQMSINSHESSLTSRMLDDYHRSESKETLDPQVEEGIKWAVATLYGGGADTTVSSMISFVLAMVKFPDVQKKAQEEIDKAVGVGHLPGFEHRHQLPYVDAIVKETLRWFPVAAMGIPHTTETDIHYRGYDIPKGTILVAGTWWLLHDPQVYKSPDIFDPTRYISPRDEPDPTTYCFGYGRRACPGRHVADANIFLGIAQLLACFNFDKAVDDNGVPIDPQVQSIPGVIDHPVKFPYKITPRSPTHSKLIMSLKEDCYPRQGDSSKLDGLGDIESVLGKP